MPKMTFHMGVTLRCYGNVEVEAESVEAAFPILTADYIGDNISIHETTTDSGQDLAIIDVTDADTGERLADYGGHPLPSIYDHVCENVRWRPRLASPLEQAAPDMLAALKAIKRARGNCGASPFEQAACNLMDEAIAKGESAVAAGEGVGIGKRYRFDYPTAFKTLEDYSAHRGQQVTVIRLATKEEADGPEVGETQHYLVRADDGWEGLAIAGELSPFGSETVDALTQAEAFISGFEDDKTQEGIADILAGLRAAIPREQARPDPQPVAELLAALRGLAGAIRFTEVGHPVVEVRDIRQCHEAALTVIAKVEGCAND
ncbi:MAG: hypothetical protein E5V63_29620 [Mesorhizobium sp.]|nr:MAG: hypothetical protein E5V63_29620 [Mesorhizobium sp.]